jgi:type IV conjugative transfer system protein TraL
MKNPANSILKKLDNPVRILSFSIGDLVAYLSPFFIGSLFDSLFVVPLIGVVTIFLVKRVLQRFAKFYVMRFLYWSLPTKRFNKMLKIKLPPSNKHLWVK